MRPVALLAISALAAACDADCGDPARMDGAWSTWSNVTDASTVTGENLEDYPFEEALFNGWTDWQLKWVPGAKSFQLAVDEEPFTATYAEEASSCNAFNLDFSGTWETAEGTRHDFRWEGNLRYYGDELGGTFSYADEWYTSGSGGASGTIVVPEAEFTASPPESVDTTGA